MTRKALLILTHGPLLPITNGGSYRTLAIAKNLSKEHSAVIIMTECPSEYCCVHNENIQVKKYPRWLMKLASLLTRLSLTQKVRLKYAIPIEELPLFISAYDWGLKLRCLFLGIKYKAAKLQAEFPGFVAGFSWLRLTSFAELTANTQNIETERIFRIHNLSNTVMYDSMLAIETKLLDRADKINLVSKRDEDTLLQQGIAKNKISILPNGINLADLGKSHSINLRETFSLPANEKLLVFHGATEYPANQQAIAYLIQYVLPLVRSRNIPASLIVVGKRPEKVLNSEHVYYTGYVSNLFSILKACDLAVLPIHSGGGTRIKVLEYFAVGLPVVSSKVGVEGLEIQADEHYLLAEDPAEYVDSIEAILNKKQFADNLVKTSYNWVKQYDWSVLLQPHCHANSE